MSRVRGYKKAESRFVKTVGNFFKAIGRGIAGGFSSFVAFFRRKMTIMIVPHSQQKSLNFQVSILSLFCSGFLFLGILGTFIWLSTETFAASGKLATLKQESQKTQASLELLKNETSDLLKSAKNFRETLSGTLTSLGLQSVMSDSAGLQDNSDLSLLFAVPDANTNMDVLAVKNLSNYLSDVIQPVQEMGKVLETQAAFVSDIPSLWPIKGGYGYVTMRFGQNRHPFTQQWYIHTGIDLATGSSGSPIIATADGQVVTVEYDSGWGNYVIIKHKHGFYTRYAHLQSFSVQRGQNVQQGQVIGYLGNTGISTGPHLHYEVHIGADIVDPAQYLNIKKR